ncbi:LamG-like jellyroll fold domain-containing protein [Salegentibacter sp. HM20]
MKNYIKSVFGLLFLAVGFASCEYDGIDPLTQIDPGPDAGAPEINIQSPSDGATIQVPQAVASVNIRFEVIDDIEVDHIEVLVNGNQIATYDDFLDYRIVKEQLTFDQVTNGEHTLTINATDIAGNTTTKSVSFSKEPPYTPRYAGEFFYMPFNGDFMELVNIYEAEETGSPAITGNSYLGSGAYLGAEGAYIDVPLNQEDLGGEFTGVFWYKMSAEADRAGILVAGANEERQQGFRLFREGNAESQTIKLNVGTGSGESWNDGGSVPVNGEWVHIAFSITPSQSILYVNGMPINTGNLTGAIDWTGVEQLTIGAGGETFSYWNHNSDVNSVIDELRLFDRAMTQAEIQDLINASSITLDMPFDGNYNDLVANREVTEVGSPGFAGESVAGSNAYAGAEGAYLTMPSAGLLGEEFSATMWYKLNASPNRAGIIVVGPEDADSPDAQNDRTSGFRFFRENGAEGHQRFKLNVGDGSADTWVDGGTAADVPNDAGWVHLAFTISQSTAIVYINGEPVRESSFGGIDWTGTDIVSIMSGAPRFTEWGHLSDQSYLDELRFYNKVLTQEDIQAAMGE